MLNIFNISEGYTLLVVASGAALLGIISGIIGSFAVLKKQSLLADAVSHASLPGIVLAFIITGTKSHPIFLLGAALVAWVAAMQIFFLVKSGKLKQDSSLGLILSVYFGFGMVLLSFIQHKPNSAQAGIETFLFGQAATMLISDVKVIIIVGFLIFALLMIFWKELFVVAFDSAYAHSIGLPVTALEILFSFMLVGTVVVGLQTVGVVLMSAMLIAPAIAARQWTNNLKFMLFISAFFGAISGITGSILSSFVPNLPTGPSIIITISIIAIVSILLAPKRGIYFNYLRNKRKHTSADASELLNALFVLSLQNPEQYGHSADSIYPLKVNTNELLKELRIRGFAIETEDKKWLITSKGKEYVVKTKEKWGAL